MRQFYEKLSECFYQLSYLMQYDTRLCPLKRASRHKKLDFFILNYVVHSLLSYLCINLKLKNKWTNEQTNKQTKTTTKKATKKPANLFPQLLHASVEMSLATQTTCTMLRPHTCFTSHSNRRPDPYPLPWD